MIIREVNKDEKDIKELIQIDKATFGDISENVSDIKKVIESPNYKILVASYDDKLVGFVGLMFVNTLHYDAMWIDLLAVSPDYRNKGIATELVKKAVQHSKTLNLEFISALVRTDNHGSLKTLDKFGFKHEGNEFKLLIKDAI